MIFSTVYGNIHNLDVTEQEFREHMLKFGKEQFGLDDYDEIMDELSADGYTFWGDTIPTDKITTMFRLRKG
jgi:hypothetical protein